MSSSQQDDPWTGPAQPTWRPPSAGSGQPPYGSQQAHPPALYPPPTYLSPTYGGQQTPQPQLTAPVVGGYGPPPIWVPPVPTYPYTVWGRRVGAYLIDFAPAYVAMTTFWVGYVLFYVRILQVTAGGSAAPTPAVFGELLRPALVWMIIGVLLMLAAFGWQWYNRWLIAGRTGQSLGKRVLEAKLVAEVNGQPIGPVNAFLRDLLHILDGAAYIGYLWPLWDAKRQTFADMIMKTVVIDRPAPANSVPHTPAHPYGPAA